MNATILDTVTGKTHTVDGVHSFQWAENNYSCDCNRVPDELHDEMDAAFPGVCMQYQRFLVIAAEFTDPDEHRYTLQELNANYPAALLQQHLTS